MPNSPLVYTQDLSTELTEGTAISIVDGRYRRRLRSLANKFSEAALQRARTAVEVRYLLELSDWEAIRTFNEQERFFLHSVYQNFGLGDFNEVKRIERGEARGADVKAVELYIKGKLRETSLEDVYEMVHIALTSDDVTNIALMSSTRQALREDYSPPFLGILEKLAYIARNYKGTAMLGRTHGRPAQPTTFGKEMGVVARRVAKWAKKIYDTKLEGKLSGAIGNYTDHYAAFPDIDWIRFAEKFVTDFGLVPNISTTQILPYDEAIDLFGKIESVNRVLIGLAQDMWQYTSDDWLLLKQGGISSVMAQKTNPEDFERAEGALQMSNSDFNFLRWKLATSRLQRDLSNSLATRRFGDAFGLSILGYQNLSSGLDNIGPDIEEMLIALREHPEIISSMVQTILRTTGMESPYESLQELTRGKEISIEDIRSFVKNLEVDATIKERLLDLDPERSFGVAPRLAEQDAEYTTNIIKEIRKRL